MTSTAVRRWSIVVACAATAGFVWLPSRLVGGSTSGHGRLVGDASSAVAGYWSTSTRTFTADLDQLVSDWRWYHAIKAVTALVAVAAAVVFVVSSRRAGTGRAARGAAIGFGSVAVVLTMANVQGAVAPFASLVSLLPVHSAQGPFADTAAQIRSSLVGPAGTVTPAPLAAMVDDFGRYHAVLALLAAVVCLALVVLAVWTWRHRARWGLAGTGLAFAAMAVITLANVSNALAPADGLRAFFAG